MLMGESSFVMHGVVKADHDKWVAITADSKTRITYHKTPDGAKWVQNTVDIKTGRQLHNYVGGKGIMKGSVPFMLPQ